MTNEFQRFITQVADGENLAREQAGRAVQIMMLGAATPAQMAAWLTALRLKGETPEEITGAAMAMRAKMETITAPAGAIDVCGTGGDGKGSYNVSTAVAIVVAGAGVPVVKHGNRSVSSHSGSADVLSALRVNVQADKNIMEKALNEANLCFLFAPLYHKAMRHIAPVRQELGIRTIFNLLGPLVNPAKPNFQLMGVYDKNLLQPMAEVLRALGSTNAWVVHGSDGMDELTLDGPSHVAELKDGQIRFFDITAEEAGIIREEPAQVKGGLPETNARALELLLGGKENAYRDIVIFNAGAALYIAGKAASVTEGVKLAAESIDTRRAKEVLASLVRISNEPKP